MRRFEFVEGSSSKFWEVEVAGDALTVRYGRIGTQGQVQTKSFAGAAKDLASRLEQQQRHAVPVHPHALPRAGVQRLDRGVGHHACGERGRARVDERRHHRLAVELAGQELVKRRPGGHRPRQAASPHRHRRAPRQRAIAQEHVHALRHLVQPRAHPGEQPLEQPQPQRRILDREPFETIVRQPTELHVALGEHRGRTRVPGRQRQLAQVIAGP